MLLPVEGSHAEKHKEVKVTDRPEVRLPALGSQMGAAVVCGTGAHNDGVMCRKTWLYGECPQRHPLQPGCVIPPLLLALPFCLDAVCLHQTWHPSGPSCFPSCYPRVPAESASPPFRFPTWAGGPQRACRPWLLWCHLMQAWDRGESWAQMVLFFPPR